MRDYIKICHDYAQNCVNGTISVGKLVKLACKRHLDDLAKQNDSSFEWRFDETKAIKPCKFAEMQVHVKGEWAGNFIELAPWQVFIFCNLFGWVSKNDGYRKYRECYIEVPRKNGKSVLAATLANYMFLGAGEEGAEVYSGATTEKQAWEVFRPAKQMIEKSPGLKDFFGVEIFAKSMFYARKLCRFEPVIGKPGDGASPSCAIVDEYHEHQTSDLVDTMLTGMGARREPLLIEITTAGTNTAGPCKIQHDFVENILSGKIKKDRMFGIVYSVDKGDDWADFEVWKKANPNYGISINDEFLKEQYLTATQKVSQQNIIRCKHLNQWLSVDTSWIDMLKLRNCIDTNLKVSDMKGKRCVIGLDLATKIDVATVCLCFWDNGNYYSFNKFYLPRTTVERPENQHYQTWEKEGILTVTEGAVIDYSIIESDIVELYNTFNCEGVAFDPWQATQLSQNLEKQGLVMIETRAVVGNFSEPMKELEGAIYSNKYHFDGNAMMEWMFSNVVAHYDRKDNIYPNKARNENKIDGVVALIMCLNLVIRLNNKEEEEEAGFAFF